MRAPGPALKQHLITEDDGSPRAMVKMACGKTGRVRTRYGSGMVEGDTWKGQAIAPTGFVAHGERTFYPDPRRSCATCIEAYGKL